MLRVILQGILGTNKEFCAYFIAWQKAFDRPYGPDDTDCNGNWYGLA